MDRWLERAGELASRAGSSQVWIVATVVSVGLLVGSVLCAGWVVNGLPEDFLVAEKPSRRHRGGQLGRVLKNVLGAVLLLAGILMLALPGQGLLTILAALAILDFPGKHRLMVRLLSRPRVLSAVNRLRRRARRTPLRSGVPELINE